MKLLTYQTIFFNKEGDFKPKIRYYNKFLKFDHISPVIKDDLFLIIDNKVKFDLSVLKQLVYEQNIAYGDIFVKEINKNVKICLPLVNSNYSNIPKIVKIDKSINDKETIEKLNEVFNKNAKEQYLNFLIDINTIYITNYYFEFIVETDDTEIKSLKFNKVFFLCPSIKKYKNKKEEKILKSKNLVELFFIDNKTINKIDKIFNKTELENFGSIQEGDVLLRYIDITKENTITKKVQLDNNLIDYLTNLEKEINEELYIYIITYTTHYFFYENDEFISTLEYEDTIYPKIREFFSNYNISFIDFCDVEK